MVEDALYVCERNEQYFIQVGLPGRKQSIKHLSDHGKGNKMSQPSGTGYGINPFGKASTRHTSTRNITVSV